MVKKGWYNTQYGENGKPYFASGGRLEPPDSDNVGYQPVVGRKRLVARMLGGYCVVQAFPG